ncbi:hypothetical protein H3N56_02545 [Cetobacterium sp. 2A]|uniref:hypothetical protein n=1 Tax=Cetobacterium sp. 2A TaxID=2754723 RepID=UPI00163B6937|nr:hypothetical protein [Cetobacterium sp. 2A]MBC2855372.1 hypothetical protein [Cetobacterium sp. 2A]
MSATGLTLEEARVRYRGYLAAEESVLLGQEYELSTGEKLTRADLNKIRAGLKYWEEKCIELSDKELCGIGIYPIGLR